MKAAGRIIFALIVFGLGSPFFSQGESVTILQPKVFPESAQHSALITKIVQWSVARANDLYGKYIDVDFNQRGQRAEYSVQVNAYFSDTSSNLNVQVLRNRDGAESPEIPILGEITAQSAIHLANTIFYQWSSFYDYLAPETAEAPVYVEQISLDLTSQSLFGMNGMLAPWSVAVEADSNILVGTATVCLEMDRHFRLLDQPGRELYEEGEYGYGNIVAVTPAGTIFLKSFSTGKVTKWFGSGIKPQSWKIGTEFMGSFTALPDGSALAAHAGQQQTLRLKDRMPTEVQFLTRPDLYYSAVAAGPDGNIWIYSTAEPRVRIYTMEGQLVDSIIPLAPDQPVPTQIAVYPDGSFLFFAQGWLYRFQRNGVPFWYTNELLGPDEFASLNNAWVAPDSSTGLIYLADVQGRRIIKLLDRSYVEDPDSPISSVFGKTAVVDTVRFPRTTLLIRSGDCDDTSALLGSLLESVGVSTAIMTSPGHVFLAFNTGDRKKISGSSTIETWKRSPTRARSGFPWKRRFSKRDSFRPGKGPPV